MTVTTGSRAGTEKDRDRSHGSRYGSMRSMISRRSRKIEKLGITLEKVLNRRGLASKLKEYRLFGQWERAVGSVIARHAQPSAIRGKKLTVTVDSSAWMQQLSLLRPEIINKVNS